MRESPVIGNFTQLLIVCRTGGRARKAFRGREGLGIRVSGREELRCPVAGCPLAQSAILCYAVCLLHAALVSHVRIAHSLSGVSLTHGSVKRGQGQVPSHLCPSQLRACSSWLEEDTVSGSAVGKLGRHRRRNQTL